MLTIVVEPGRVIVEMTAPSPVVYLDHGVMGQISEEPRHADRLVALLRHRGTLALSYANFADIAGQDRGSSLQDLETLLTRVDGDFAFVDMNPANVAKREIARVWSAIDAAFDFGAAVTYAFDEVIVEGPVSARRIVEWVHASRGNFVGSVGRKMEENRALLESGRERYARPRQRFPRVFPNSHVDLCFNEVINAALHAGWKFTTNDSMDLFHAVVPLATCDFVALDKKWHDVTNRVAKPPWRACVFSGKKGQIELFLSALEAWSPPPEVK